MRAYLRHALFCLLLILPLQVVGDETEQAIEYLLGFDGRDHIIREQLDVLKDSPELLTEALYKDLRKYTEHKSPAVRDAAVSTLSQVLFRDPELAEDFVSRMLTVRAIRTERGYPDFADQLYEAAKKYFSSDPTAVRTVLGEATAYLSAAPSFDNFRTNRFKKPVRNFLLATLLGDAPSAADGFMAIRNRVKAAENLGIGDAVTQRGVARTLAWKLAVDGRPSAQIAQAYADMSNAGLQYFSKIPLSSAGAFDVIEQNPSKRTRAEILIRAKAGYKKDMALARELLRDQTVQRKVDIMLNLNSNDNLNPDVIPVVRQALADLEFRLALPSPVSEFVWRVIPEASVAWDATPGVLVEALRTHRNDPPAVNEILYAASRRYEELGRTGRREFDVAFGEIAREFLGTAPRNRDQLNRRRLTVNLIKKRDVLGDDWIEYIGRPLDPQEGLRIDQGALLQAREEARDFLIEIGHKTRLDEKSVERLASMFPITSDGHLSVRRTKSAMTVFGRSLTRNPEIQRKMIAVLDDARKQGQRELEQSVLRRIEALELSDESVAYLRAYAEEDIGILQSLRREHRLLMHKLGVSPGTIAVDTNRGRNIRMAEKVFALAPGDGSYLMDLLEKGIHFDQIGESGQFVGDIKPLEIRFDPLVKGSVAVPPGERELQVIARAREAFAEPIARFLESKTGSTFLDDPQSRSEIARTLKAVQQLEIKDNRVMDAAAEMLDLTHQADKPLVVGRRRYNEGVIINRRAVAAMSNVVNHTPRNQVRLVRAAEHADGLVRELAFNVINRMIGEQAFTDETARFELGRILNDKKVKKTLAGGRGRWPGISEFPVSEPDGFAARCVRAATKRLPFSRKNGP